MKRRNEGSRHRYWPDKERVRTAATWYFRTRINEGEGERERERPDASRIKVRRDEDKRIAPSEYQWRTRRNRIFEKNGFKVECGGTRRGVSLSTETPHPRGAASPDFFADGMVTSLEAKKMYSNILELPVFGTPISFLDTLRRTRKRRTCSYLQIRREINPCNN